MQRFIIKFQTFLKQLKGQKPIFSDEFRSEKTNSLKNILNLMMAWGLILLSK